MTSGGDTALRRKNKSRRRKLHNESSKVSARVATIIAAKKRRKSGKRRKCEGMCFSLPTVDDPFNDRHGKSTTEIERGGKRPQIEVFKKTCAKNKIDPLKKGNVIKHKSDLHRPKEVKLNVLVEDVDKKLYSTKHPKKGENSLTCNSPVNENLECPSKFLIMCLNSVENVLRHDMIYNIGDEKPLFASTWGFEFLKSYSSGKDVLETSISGCTVEKIAWIASVAADNVVKKEKEGVLFDSPFLLFLVPSREEAVKVRQVCKPLKSLGIHTVSLHSGASLGHQVQGLKSCEPEFIVSTPNRLLELVCLKAVDLSRVYSVVVDGDVEDTHVDDVLNVFTTSTRQPQFTIFSKCLKSSSAKLVESLLRGPVCHLSRDGAFSEGVLR